MSTTPQIIKDKEFQVKFRGYDPIEVKAYLDELAEEFFELQERCRLQVDDLQILHEQRAELEEQKVSMAAAGTEARKMAEELRQAGLLTEQKFAVLVNEAESLRNRIAALEREKQEQASLVLEMEARIQKAEEATRHEQVEKEALGHRIALMEEQQREARKDEVDFRSTLSVAQQFCDAMKEKSQQEARALLDATRDEIEAIRRAAHAELASLPDEIRELQRKRDEARGQLRAILESHLRDLDNFSEKRNDGWRDSDELFQKILVLEDGTLLPSDQASLALEQTGAGCVPPVEEEADLLSVFESDEPSGDDRSEQKSR